MTQEHPEASQSTTPHRRSTYQPPTDEDAVDDITIVSRRGAASRRAKTRAEARRSERLDDLTTLTRRRGAPVDDATTVSARRADPVDDATSVSTRRADPVDDATSLSTRRADPVDDATSLSRRRGGPVPESAAEAAAPGPRRSGSTAPSSVMRDAATADADADDLAFDASVMGDTILRPTRGVVPGPPSDDHVVSAGTSRAAYVPTADDIADRRAPRRAEAAFASRRGDPSPRSLERTATPEPGTSPRRRASARVRMLVIGGCVVAAAALCALALVLLLG